MPHYHPDHPDIVAVHLAGSTVDVVADGVVIQEAIECDTDAGWYRVHCYDKKGNPIIDRNKGEWITKTVRADVQIRWPVDNVPKPS